MRSWIAGIVGLLVIGSSALAQGVAPIGGQFQINTYTTNHQVTAALASDAEGAFVVVWGSLGGVDTDLTGWSIQARRYDATGIALGGEFQVNSYTTSSQEIPAVAADDLGNFVVAWEGKYQDDPSSGHPGILAQRFDSSGTPVGDEFQVNSYTTYSQLAPSAAIDSDGNFVVAWSSYFPDGSQSSVQAQRYDDSGTPVGGEFQVNSYTTSYQRRASVGFDQDGDFVVAWESVGSYGSDKSHWSVQAQRFDNTGAMTGGEFQVNSYTTSHQYRPALAVNGAGDFVIAWESFGSYGTDTDRWSIQAQRFDATGAVVGDQFQVNSYTTYDQYKPSVGIDEKGAFIVVWESEGSAGTDTGSLSIQGQFFDASGAPLGSQFQVNSYTSSKQQAPSVSAVDAEGNFVVVWESLGSYDSDSSSYSIQGQHFASRPVLIDSFESGDLSAWSNVVQ